MADTSEAFRDQLDDALESAIAGDHDLDQIETALQDAQTRVEEIRMLRGEA